MNKKEARQKLFEKLYNSWREKFRQEISASPQLKPFLLDIFDFIGRYGRRHLDDVTTKNPSTFEALVLIVLKEVTEDLEVLDSNQYRINIIEEIRGIGLRTLEAFVESEKFDEHLEESEPHGFGKQFGEPVLGPMEFADPRPGRK